MIMIIAIAASLAADPGPLDGFKANLYALDVKCNFTYTKHVVEYSWISQYLHGDGSSAGIPDIPGTPSFSIVGQWDHFEDTERVLVQEIKQYNRKNQPLPYEILFDDQGLAFHFLDDDFVRLQNLDRVPVPLYGPFAWWDVYPFPTNLDAEYAEATRSRKSTLRHGRAVELEVYHQVFPQGFRQIEISYDPSVNFLPRYIKAFSVSEKSGVAAVRETYLLNAVPCKSGGVLPTEWYETSYRVSDFAEQYRTYTDHTILKPTGKVVVGHFTASEIRSIDEAPAITRTAALQLAASPGGYSKLPKATSQGFKLRSLRHALGKKLTTPPQKVNANIDYAELQAHRGTPSGSIWKLSFFVLICACVIAMAAKLRKLLICIVLTTIVSQSGCSRSPSVPHLNSRFDNQPYIIDVLEPTREFPLRLINDGNTTLRLFDIDGGCSCRKIDKSLLPVDLPSGTDCSVPIGFSGLHGSETKSFFIKASTDHGELIVPAECNILMSHVIDPSSLVFNSVEGRDRDSIVELNHRAIYKENHPSEALLVFPKSFQVEHEYLGSQPLANAPGYVFSDTKYTISLLEKRLGTHKESILLQQNDGRKILEVPVVLQHLPFVSSIPEQVYLGPKSCRVFLRCPDESVELTKITHTPPGVSAVISSPRELVVSLQSTAPAILNDYLSVATSAAGGTVLRVHLIRYSAATNLTQSQIP